MKVDDKRLFEKVRKLETLIEAAKMMNKGDGLDHHIEHLLELAMVELVSLRAQLWGDALGPKSDTSRNSA